MHSDRQACMTPRRIWRYKDVDYRKACQMIDETDWDGLLYKDDIDCSAINWHNGFMGIMSTCIPQQSLKCRRNLLWLITRHIRMRNAACQTARKSTPNPENYITKS